MIGEDQKKVMEYLQQCNGLFNELAKESIHNIMSGSKTQVNPFINADKMMSLVSQSVTLDPAIYMKEHLNYLEKQGELVQAASKAMTDGDFDEVAKSDVRDSRFKDSEWFDNPFYNYIRQSYLINADFFTKVINSLDFADEKAALQAKFLTRQYVNSVSPANYVLTNPEVCREIIETEGHSIMKGMDRFFKDLEASPIEAFKLNQVDKEAFTVGVDIATSPGAVVFRNELIELIQYTPVTDKQYQVPILLVPPFINKYYILDISEEKSLVRWLNAQGFNVFIISWINPDETLSQLGLDNYIKDGVVKAIDTIIDKTGAEQVHTAGYCIGGTLLASTQSYLNKQSIDTIASISLLTVLLDFEAPGEVGNYLSEQTFSYIEQSAQQKGFFDGRIMAMSFSLLRENNLFWSFFVENYLKGRDQTPFDILYWNGDSTNIPAKCFIEFVKHSYVENNFIHPNKVQIDNIGIDFSDIDIPTYCLAAKSDHIVLWQSAFESAKHLPHDTRFVLAGSGHVAGVINPAADGKYPHWVGLPPKGKLSAQEWFDQASEKKGSWWNDWHEWLVPKSGKKIKAKGLESKKYPILEAAPGCYVKRRLDTK